MSYAEVKRLALELSEEEREQLVTEVFLSLPEPEHPGPPVDGPPIDAETVNRRIAEIDSGAVRGIPHEEVMANARRVLAGGPR